VYPDTTNPSTSLESNSISIEKSSRYGFHKYLAETYVRTTHSNSIIMRMGGFVGLGMRKNAIFDMMNDKPLWLDLDSELTFINTDTAARLVYGLYENGITNETINLGPRNTVKLNDIYKRLNSQSVKQPEAKKVRFELNIDKLSQHASHALPETMQELEAFFIADGR
jgi:nucleoside-diphosphate-sugar epimerase